MTFVESFTAGGGILKLKEDVLPRRYKGDASESSFNFLL